MSLFGLTLRSMLARRYVVLLTVLSIATSVALLVGVARLREEVHNGFARTVTGADLLIGPRSSPIGLMLSTIFHVGEPAGGISWNTYRAIAAKKGIAWSIPLSLGDSLRGFPVLGTNASYWAHYRYGDDQPLRFQAGRRFAGDGEAVLGSDVATRLNATLGQALTLSHGEGAVSFAPHEGHPFLVVGILAPTGTPIDRTVHIDLSGVVSLHDVQAPFMPAFARDALRERAKADPYSPYAITGILVGLRSPDLVFVAARAVDSYRREPLTAVLPGVALQSLWETVGTAERALLVISWGVLLSGLTGMALAILASLEARRRELAILRSIGASPATIVTLIVMEAIAIVGTGIMVGMIALQLAIIALGGHLAASYGIILSPGLPTPGEIKTLAAILASAMVLAALPAIQAYRTTLSDGLMIGR